MLNTNGNMSALAYSLEEEQLIQSALRCLEKRVNYGSDVMTHPENVRTYLRLKLGGELNEVFYVLLLDNAHRVIAFEKLFDGTVNACSIYPRVVLQKVFAFNAAAVIFAHNHPSGIAEPSAADKQITQRMKEMLSIIDVRVLDHIIVSPDNIVSFSERGLL